MSAWTTTFVSTPIRTTWQSVKATFVFTSGSIIFKLIFGLIAALLLHSLKRGRNLITALVLLPWIIPSVVQALAWKSIYDPLFGGLNPMLMGLGLLDKPLSWLADPESRHGVGDCRQCLGRHSILHRQHVGRHGIHR